MVYYISPAATFDHSDFGEASISSGNLLCPSPWVTNPRYPFRLSLRYVTLQKRSSRAPKLVH